MCLFPGILAFLLFLLFDFNKIRWYWKPANLFFAVGIVLLILSTILCIFKSDLSDFSWHAGSILGLITCLVSAAGLVYALFFALPFRDTYTESQALPVVTSGLYGLCRHPAFWPMLVLYISLWLTFGGKLLLAATICYPLCNFIYICIQDQWIFPCYIRGYSDYRKKVPFLIPRWK